MSKEKGTRVRKPPSFAWQHFEAVLPSLAKRAPARVETQDVEAWGAGFKTAEKIIAALKFLGVLTEEGEPVREAWAALRSTQGDRRELRPLIERAYAPLFGAFHGGLAQVDLTEVAHEIGKQWRVETTSRTRAAQFFAGLCAKAGIDLHSDMQGKKRKSVQSSVGAVDEPRAERLRTRGKSRTPESEPKTERTAPAGDKDPASVGSVPQLPLVFSIQLTGRETQAELEGIFETVKKAWGRVWARST